MPIRLTSQIDSAAFIPGNTKHLPGKEPQAKPQPITTTAARSVQLKRHNLNNRES